QRLRLLADDASPDVADPISNLLGRNNPQLAALELLDQDSRSGCAAACVELARDRQERRVGEIELCCAHDRICDAILTRRRSVACHPAAAATRSRTRDPPRGRESECLHE